MKTKTILFARNRKPPRHPLQRDCEVRTRWKQVDKVGPSVTSMAFILTALII